MQSKFNNPITRQPTMSKSRSAYSVFAEVDELVSKPVLGSDGAATWQEFKKASGKPFSAGTAPALRVKRSDRLGTGLSTLDEERGREEEVRREGGDAPLGGGYTEFKRRGPDSDEIASKKRARLILERVRPDGVTYFVKAETFDGCKEDYVFTTRERGTGYYWDGMESAKKQMGLPSGEIAQEANVNDSTVTEEKKTKKKKKRKKPDVSEEGLAVEPNGRSMHPMEQVAAAIQRMKESGDRSRGQGVTSPLTAQVSGQPLADGWEMATDPSTCRIYYFHRPSRERRWDPPPGGSVVKDSKISLSANETTPSHHVDGESAIAKGLAVESNEGDNLPDGWKAIEDKDSSRLYYYHSSGKTSWVRPTA